ncbi:hypothetical protein GUITHDRAFT_149694, partial [Guillardia theta CCMP2712]
KHGEELVLHSLGFLLASSPLGVGDCELMDLLSCRDSVLAEHSIGSFSPPQKRLPRARWASLKLDLLALSLLLEVSSPAGRVWTLSHLVLERILEDRVVGEKTLASSLRVLKSMYTGELTEDMGGRIIMQRAHEDTLGGGGINRRKLHLLPLLLRKLIRAEGGHWADKLASFLSNPSFMEQKRRCGKEEDVVEELAAGVWSIATMRGSKKSFVDSCVNKLLAIARQQEMRGTFSMTTSGPSRKIVGTKLCLLEWEVERTSLLCLQLKKNLLTRSHDPSMATLGSLPDIPSVTKLREERQK